MCLGERIQYDLRKMMFNHLQDLSLSYYAQNAVGRLIARVTSDSGRVADLMTWGVVDTTWAFMNITTSLIFMTIINWQLALIVSVIIPIMVIIAVQFRKRILVEFRNSRRANSKITGAYNENIQGVRVVKALGREDENLKEFQLLTSTMYHASYRAAWLSALFLPTVQIIAALALGSHRFLRRDRDTSWVDNHWRHQCLRLLSDLYDVAGSGSGARLCRNAAFHRFRRDGYLNWWIRPPEVHNKTDAVPASTLLGDIEFDHVDFYYEDRKPVLTDFSLKVKAGEIIALVGPTGGGKSTIVNLLCRFYEPTHRRDPHQWARLYRLHPGIDPVSNRHRLQTPHLFSGTVRENIRYGRLACN